MNSHCSSYRGKNVRKEIFKALPRLILSETLFTMAKQILIRLSKQFQIRGSASELQW